MKQHDAAVARLDAAELLAQGLTAQQAALRLGCAEEDIYGWMSEPEVMEQYRKCVLRREVIGYAKAVERITGQMDDENPTVSLRAAKEALDRFGESAMQLGGREVVVRVEGMPTIGMPGAEDEP